MKVDLSGADELISVLKRVDKARVDSALIKCVKTNASELEGHAKEIVPVDTGTLSRSINTKMEDGGKTAVTEPDTDYMTYVEYGTYKMAAQPYIRPSFYRQEPAFKEDVKKVVEEFTKGR